MFKKIKTMMENKREREPETGGKKLSSVRKVLTLGYLTAICWIGFTLPAFAATNPGENARTLVMGWLKPVVYLGMGIFSVVMIFKRKFSELFTFLPILLIAVALMFYPEVIVNFFGTIVTTVFG